MVGDVEPEFRALATKINPNLNLRDDPNIFVAEMEYLLIQKCQTTGTMGIMDLLQVFKIPEMQVVVSSAQN